MSRVDDKDVSRDINVYVCEVCNKKCSYAETRLAELPCVEQEGEYEENKMQCRTYQAIGIRFIHFDSSICDKPLYELVEI